MTFEEYEKEMNLEMGKYEKELQKESEKYLRGNCSEIDLNSSLEYMENNFNKLPQIINLDD